MNDISLVGNAIQITRDNNSPKGYVNVPIEYDTFEEHGNTYVSLLIGKDNFTWKITELTIGGDTIDDLADAITKLSAVFPNANSGNGGSGGVTDITYTALVTAIGASGLTAGQQYRITDYATVHYIVDGNITQHVDSIITGINEPLIVTASSSNTLEPVAYSALHPEDIIHYDWNPANWLDDVSFADLSGTPTIITGFKGVIYFRHDSLLDNYLPYDFRNCKFRRWKTNCDTWSAVTTYNGSSSTSNYVNSNGFIYKSLQAANLNKLPADNPDFWQPLLDLSKTEYWSARPIINFGIPSSAEFADFKTFAEGAGSATYEGCCRSNYFGVFKDNNPFDDICNTILLNHVFFLQDVNYFVVFANVFAPESYGCTFGGKVNNNSFGSYFDNNIIADGFSFNVIGNFFNTNLTGSGFNFNQCASAFRINLISTNCANNIFGTTFQNKIIGSDFKMNTTANDMEDTMDFTSATHVYASYSCNLFLRVDGTAKLSYCDNSDVIQVVNANA